MRTSSILSLRQIASKIHPPLPISPRDSQRLLSLLSASFRAQLDKQHGRVYSKNSLATDKLFKSILTNPLLGLPPHESLSPLSGAHQKHGGAPTGRSQLIQNLALSPIEFFKRHIAAGTASVEVAKRCLEAHLRNISTSRKVEPSSGTPTSDSGPTIINWLWSSGHEDNLEFLKDQPFTRVLVPFLVAEGRGFHAWSWFRRLQSELQNDSLDQSKAEIVEEKTKAQTYLLKALIWSEMGYGAGLSGALRAFVDAFLGSSRCGETVGDVAVRVFPPTGLLLLARLMKMDTTAAIDPHLVDKLLQNVKAWSGCSVMDRARLLLLHPLSPDPYPALEYIQRLMVKQRQFFKYRQRREEIALCLKTSEILISKGNHEDAQWILHFAQDTFPQELGLHGPGGKQAEEKSVQDDKAASETASLQQLDALAFG